MIDDDLLKSIIKILLIEDVNIVDLNLQLYFFLQIIILLIAYSLDLSLKLTKISLKTSIGRVS